MRTATLARLSTAVTLLFAFAQTAGAASFTDISGSANADAIEYLHAHGVIGGYSDGTFRPDGLINRAELAKILVGAEGGASIPASAYYQNCFKDVHEQEWYVIPVCYSLRMSWVQGYSDDTFHPERPVNTAEAIKMIMEAQKIHESFAPEFNTYTDVDSNTWYTMYIETANRRGLLQRESGTLGIGANITRGQVAEIIYRAMVINASGAERFGMADDTTPPSSSSSAPASSEPAAMETKYRNGTYAADGTYFSPGGSELIHVTLTLKDDVVVDSTYSGTARGGNSAYYQQVFGEGYKQLVVGKKLDEIQLDVVNGSSLTPRGFMDAVAKIQAQAKA